MTGLFATHPRLRRLSIPVFAGGCCAALVLALLAGFVPGREGGELRLPVTDAGPDFTRYARQNTRPLDTTVWMVRQPLKRGPLSDIEADGLKADGALVGFSPEGVSILTTSGPRFLGSQGEPHDLFQSLSQQTRGLPVGLNLDHTAMVAGSAMPWCVPAPGQNWSKASDMSQAWLRKRVMPFGDIVNTYVRRYNLDRELVYAIMYTESGFNPLAISNRHAHGLMQVVPSTAGGEVHRYLYGKPGQPRSADLLNPSINIQYGTTYLYLLLERHMAGIKDPLAREYCAIAAYNTGPWTVHKLFGRSREEAIAAINGYTPAQVYDILQQKLPYAETREYLRKVLSLKNGMSLAAR